VCVSSAYSLPPYFRVCAPPRWTFTTTTRTRRELPRFVAPIHMHVSLCMRGAREVSVHSPPLAVALARTACRFSFFFEHFEHAL